MLQAFREHKRWLMVIAMVLIIPSFVVTGIYSYNRMSAADNAIAKVGDVAITPEMFDNSKREQLERLRQQMGEMFRAGMLDSEEGRDAILNQLLDTSAIEQTVAKNYLSISEEDAIALIKGAAAFQENGKFNPALYERFLQSQGKSDEQFVWEIRNSLARESLISAVAGSYPMPDEVVRGMYKILTEERQIRTKIVNVDQFLNKVVVKPEEIKAYYDSHQDEFKAAEHVDVEYVTLSPENFYDKVTVNKEDVLAYYEQNKQRWTVPEERNASHILIAFGDDKAASKAKAEEILARVKADPKSFAKEAKEHSIDTGSAVHGGELGSFGRGVMVPPFETAVFEAKAGDIVGPVESNFGWHIIKVNDITPAKVRPFDEVKGAIEKEYVEQMAVRLFAEKAEDFTNMVYEQADSLAPVAEEFGLTILKADDVTRDGIADPSLKALFNDHMVESLFNDESLHEKRNTSAIEVRANTLMSARVTKYVPESIRPLEEVSEDIKTGLELKKATELAKAEGEKALAALRQSKKPDADFADAVWVSRHRPVGHPAEFVNHVVAIPADKLPAFTGMTVTGGAYLIAYIDETKEKAPTDRDLQMLTSELSSVYGEADRIGYLKALRETLGEELLRPDFIKGEKTEDNL